MRERGLSIRSNCTVCGVENRILLFRLGDRPHCGACRQEIRFYGPARLAQLLMPLRYTILVAIGGVALLLLWPDDGRDQPLAGSGSASARPLQLVSGGQAPARLPAVDTGVI